MMMQVRHAVCRVVSGLMLLKQEVVRPAALLVKNAYSLPTHLA